MPVIQLRMKNKAKKLVDPQIDYDSMKKVNYLLYYLQQIEIQKWH